MPSRRFCGGETLPGRWKRPEVKEIAEAKAAYFASIADAQKSGQFPMRPERILADLREALPRNGFVVADVGWNKNGVGQQFPIYEPGTFVAPGGLATMGYGPSAALGVKVACDRKVVALIGDGGMSANVSPLATAAADNIAVVWVVMNNCAFGTIAGLENQHYEHQFGTLFMRDGEPYTPDFAAIAEAYGIKGYSVKNAAEFKPVLEEALALNKPCLIDVRMENAPVVTEGCWNINDIYRKRGEGKAVEDMALGGYRAMEDEKVGPRRQVALQRRWSECQKRVDTPASLAPWRPWPGPGAARR